MSTGVGLWISIIQIDGMLSLQLSPNRAHVSYPRQLSPFALDYALQVTSNPLPIDQKRAATLNSAHKIFM